MRIVERPSPNFNSREDQKIDMLVLHYTGMPTAAEALEKLCDGKAEHRVSAHYMVDEDGTVYKLVDERERAWHAGKSAWRGDSNINDRSIGVEIVNPGHEHGYRPFPEAQMNAVIELCKDICERHRIPSWNVVAHSDIAPDRKQDPGELFDWKKLAEHGVCMMPDREPFFTSLMHLPMKWVSRIFAPPAHPILKPGAHGPYVERMQVDLARFGYPIEVTGQYDKHTENVVTAFERHFRPNYIDGVWDKECAQALEHLLRQTPAVTIHKPDSRMAALSGVRIRDSGFRK